MAAPLSDLGLRSSDSIRAFDVPILLRSILVGLSLATSSWWSSTSICRLGWTLALASSKFVDKVSTLCYSHLIPISCLLVFELDDFRSYLVVEFVPWIVGRSTVYLLWVLTSVIAWTILISACVLISNYILSLASSFRAVRFRGYPSTRCCFWLLNCLLWILCLNCTALCLVHHVCLLHLCTWSSSFLVLFGLAVLYSSMLQSSSCIYIHTCVYICVSVVYICILAFALCACTALLPWVDVVTCFIAVDMSCTCGW